MTLEASNNLCCIFAILLFVHWILLEGLGQEVILECSIITERAENGIEIKCVPALDKFLNCKEPRGQ